LAIDNSSCGAPARGTLARTTPRRGAPRGARRNDGRGGLDDRGPKRAAQRGSHPPRAALYLRVCDADDGSRTVAPWPLTCDGLQRSCRNQLVPTITALGCARRAPGSGGRAFRSSFRGHRQASPPASAWRPASGRRPPASRSLNMSRLRARFGGPDARTRQIRILNRQRVLLTALDLPWQGGVVPDASTGAPRGHMAAAIDR